MGGRGFVGFVARGFANERKRNPGWHVSRTVCTGVGIFPVGTSRLSMGHQLAGGPARPSADLAATRSGNGYHGTRPQCYSRPQGDRSGTADVHPEAMQFPPITGRSAMAQDTVPKLADRVGYVRQSAVTILISTTHICK